MLQRIRKTYVQDPVFLDFLGIAGVGLCYVSVYTGIQKFSLLLVLIPPPGCFSFSFSKSSYWTLPPHPSIANVSSLSEPLGLPSVFSWCKICQQQVALCHLGPCGPSAFRVRSASGESILLTECTVDLCHQMTLDILVSLGSSGSIALLPWASSRLCWRGDLDCGRCPLMSVMGMLQ